MARVVIKLATDISEFLPALCREIPGCSFNPANNLAVFRRDNLIVMLNPLEITLYNTDQESEAVKILEWFNTLLNQNGEIRCA